ncbi:MAG TPA: TonB-dependent receptor [Gammaproteobacteria bacterium]
MKTHSLVMLTTALLASEISYAQSSGRISGSEFNPALSLVLEGRYADYNEDFELPGFQLGGEAGIYEKGFSIGHNELTLSANVDDKFYGLFNLAIASEAGETVTELEEAYIETLGLGKGLTVKGGQFYSGLGYLNTIHDHAHDFADVPLVYAAMFGNHLLEKGIQLRWLAPTDFFLEFGAELTSGAEFPGGENEDNNTGRTLFVKTGGDFSVSSSWQAGLSYYTAEFDLREGGGHAHGGATADTDQEILDGKTSISGIDFVYKWAPNGNPAQRNLKIQFEYFLRDEEGQLEYTDNINSLTGSADYDGDQSGFYIQGVYQWMPHWRAGLRYDHLSSDNQLSNAVGGFTNDELGEATELVTGHTPKRTSLMIDYSPSEFSRFRIQYMKDDSGEVSDDRIYLQFIASLGSHGAHKF